MMRSARSIVAGLLAAVALLGVAGPALASSVTATSWIELDGSGMQDGLSRNANGANALDRNVGAAVDPDGNPVVAYVDASTGDIIVEQLIAGSWMQLGTPPGQGFTPRVKIDSNGTINVAWLGATAVFLAQWTGTAWVGLNGSDTGTGLTGAVNPDSFGLALDPVGNPVVAFDALPAGGAQCVNDGSTGLAGEQVYVVQWNGVAWNYLGTDTTGGGATDALSFQIPGSSQAVCHSAGMPAIDTDTDGNPVVVFVYTTSGVPFAPPPTFFVSTNTDVYAVRWDGSEWIGVGPTVPTQPVGPGLGQAGGISNDANASALPGISPLAPAQPSIAIGSDNMPVVAWSDNSVDPNQTRIYTRKFSQDVRSFDISSATWVAQGASASSTGISPLTGVNVAPVVDIGISVRPVIAWQTTGTTGDTAIYVKRFDGANWVEYATGAASATGINGPNGHGALAPALGIGPSPLFLPFVAWIGKGVSVPQVFAREMAAGGQATLSVSVTGGGTGTVTSLPMGISCPTNPNACSEVFPIATTVTLTAKPDPGLTFGGWSGACTNIAGPCTVTLSSSRSVTANFLGNKLTVTTSGQGSGVSVSSPAGIACGIQCTHAFAVNAAVTVTATALPGSSFSGWTGCGGTSGPGNAQCSVVMNAVKTITARFDSATLKVVKSGTGVGSVTGTALAANATSATINCGSVCTSQNALGAALVLTATPAQGSFFNSWSGCTTVVGANCSVTMSSSLTVTANFSTNRLTVTKAGTGTGTVTGAASPANGAAALINCGTVCVTNNTTGTSVTLTAVPDPTSNFASWSGCNSVNGSTCTVAMTASKTVTATFNSVLLTVTRAGSGTGTVIGADPGDTLNCGSTCTEQFPTSKVVHLQASNTDPASAFVSWSGCTSANGSACTVSMTTARTVTATFNSNPLRVSISSVGGGTGTVTDTTNAVDCGQGAQLCKAGFPPNRVVTLTAAPATGSVFTRWSGCAPATSPTCTVTMSSSESVTATFTSETLSLSITGTGEVTSNPAGLDCTLSCTGQFQPNTPVQLTAIPASTSGFTKWTGCTSVNGSVCNITMSAAHSVAVTFTSERLTVTKTSVDGGSGTVVGPAFACGQLCFEDFPPATPVTVTATADPGSGFAGWKGCDSTGGAGGVECHATLNAARTITATFARFKLTVSKSGTGSVVDGSLAINCSPTCVADFPANSTVTLTATPGPNFGLVGFTGGCVTTNNSCTVTMSAAKTVTVTFASFTLHVSKVGHGTVTSGDGMINCGTACSAAYPPGTPVTLTAMPTGAGTFMGFTGCTAVGMSCTVTMSASKSVTATFSP